MSASQLNKMLRRHGDYTSHEIVATILELVLTRQWPQNDLPTILADFDEEARGTMRAVAEHVLDGMREDQTGFRQGYATTESGDGERLLTSEVIPRQFVEALSQIQ